MNGVKELLNKWLAEAFEKYGIVFATFVIGIFVGWQLKLWLSDRKYNKLKDRLITDKENQIADLKHLVYEKLSRISVQKEDKAFLNKIKKFFKSL